MAEAGLQFVRFSPDASGFVRRRCPSCRRGFKVDARGDDLVVQSALCATLPHVNAHEVPGAPQRWCPYCGHGADAVDFLTPAQRSYIEAWGRRLAGEVRYEVLRQAGRPGRAAGATYVVLPPTGMPPAPPPEPDDLVQESMACCGEELKLDPAWSEAFFCHHCRARHRGDGP